MMPHFRNVNWNRNDLYAVTISQVLDAVDTDTSQNEKSKTISASDRERFLAFVMHYPIILDLISPESLNKIIL